MRKNKRFLGTGIALVLALSTALPAMAEEETPIVQEDESNILSEEEVSGESDNSNDQKESDDTNDQKEPEDTTEYNGFHQAPNTSDWYYYTDGQIDTSVTDVKKGTVDGVSGWWHVVNGKVSRAETVAKNANGWWYIDETGMVDFSYNGFAKNENGSWYCENGKVTFSKQDIIQDTTGALGEKNAWYYVIESKVRTDFTGLSNFRNSHGWWYIKSGKVDFTRNSVDKNVNGWWYVTEGKVQFDFTGLANYRNANGWWYIQGGKVDFTHNGVDKNKNGWWYVTEGKVQFGFTGLANYRNSYGWWYIQDGKVDFSYKGLASNCNGVWYLEGGKVNFSFDNTYTIGNTTYTIGGGKVVLASHMAGESLTQIDLDILTSNKGTALSRTLTQSEFNQIINQYINSSYVKNVAYKSTSGGFVWNGGSRWDCSSASLYLMNDYLLTYDEAYQSAKKKNASAGTSSLISSALASVGKKANGAYPETGSAAPTNSVSQAMSWGNPVYTYKTVSQLRSGSPGSLRYGDVLFYGTISGSTVKISHVAVYLGQYYLDNGDKGYYQLENDNVVHGTTKAGRSDGVRISALRTDDLVHVARIF